MNEKNIKKLNKLFAIMDEDTLTRSEFTDAFEKVVDLIVKVKKEIEDKSIVTLNRIEELSTLATKKLKEGNESHISDIRKEIKKQMSKMHEDQSTGMNLIRDKLRSLKDGKDADEKKIVKEVLKQIVLPEYKETVLDDPKQIRNKLETLKGKERLDIKAINGLEERLSEMQTKGGVTAITGRELITPIDISDKLDGVKRTFNIQAVYSIISVALSSFPYNLRNGIDFTYTPTTITFTSEVDLSALATGQTCLITAIIS